MQIDAFSKDDYKSICKYLWTWNYFNTLSMNFQVTSRNMSDAGYTCTLFQQIKSVGVKNQQEILIRYRFMKWYLILMEKNVANYEIRLSTVPIKNMKRIL